jgi:hypothetical protein
VVVDFALAPRFYLGAAFPRLCLKFRREAEPPSARSQAEPEEREKTLIWLPFARCGRRGWGMRADLQKRDARVAKPTGAAVGRFVVVQVINFQGRA